MTAKEVLHILSKEERIREQRRKDKRQTDIEIQEVDSLCIFLSKKKKNNDFVSGLLDESCE